MTIKLVQVKAFTKDKNQGNPAGVVLEANNLTAEQMINISAQMGYSECAFVQKSTNADFRLRFFTPTEEVNLCGHATIATFHTLREKGLLQTTEDGHITTSQESNVGVLPVNIKSDGLVVMTQAKPEFLEGPFDQEEIAKLVGIEVAEVATGAPICGVSTGIWKLIVPVVSKKVLFNLKPDLLKIKEYSKQKGVRGLYVFTREVIEEGSDFLARQINPLLGPLEDPTTGVAAGALGAYMSKFKLSPKTDFIIEQGYNLNKQGKIYVDTKDTVKVGGYAVIFGEKKLTI